MKPIFSRRISISREVKIFLFIAIPLCAIIFVPLAVDYFRFCDSVIGGRISTVSGQEHLPMDAREYAPISATNLQDLRPLVIAEINAKGYSDRTIGFNDDSSILAMSNFTNITPTAYYGNYMLFWELAADEQPCFRRFDLPSVHRGDYQKSAIRRRGCRI